GIGGIETLVDRLSRRQQENGLAVSVVFGKATGELRESFSGSPVPCSFVGLNGGRDFSPRKWASARGLLEGCDVIHMHSFNPLLAAAARSTHAPIVYTEHGNFGFGRSRRTADVARTFLLARFLRRRVAYVSFNSEFTREIAERRYRLTTVPRSVVYNGIPIAPTALGEAGLAEETTLEEIGDAFVVGTSSRLAGFKRVDRLIRGFAAFGHGDRARLLIVGDGERRKSLEELAARCGVSSETLFVGYRRNVAAYQALMDVCVFPSEGEPFGVAALETLRLGKPTLAFRDGGGLVEILEDLCPQDIVVDEEHLARRLGDYFNRRDTLGQDAKARRARAAVFDIAVMSDRFDEIYAAVVTDRARRS
ncbi:MAG: glycosyltransferase, partial [Acidobacteriota bacterium]|nr:glycosyltransferase [Acidobacteriota bacterium]